MKYIKCFLFVMAFALSICSTGSIYAKNKVYPLDSRYGIVADDEDWACEVPAKGNESLGVHYGHIKGKAKYLPISFDFFLRAVQQNSLHKPNNVHAFNDAKHFLSHYAQKTSTVFSGLNIKNLEENNCFIVNGSYFDNTSSGKFAFYIKPQESGFYHYYCMFIKIPGDLLDDQAIEHLFQETFSLVTPLIIE